MFARSESIIQHDFREAMASVATPVSVVTATWEGVHYGATVSAFASLSMDPPMVLVSLDRQSTLLTAIRSAGTFGLNILAASQASLSLHFASSRGAGKFDGIEWRSEAGLPRLEGALSWIACEVAEFVEGGDHVVAFGAVVSAESAEGDPLTYHRRVFGTHHAV